MAGEKSIPKSPVEQIYDTMFAIMEKQGEFDAETLQKLKGLVLDGNFTKKRVTKAIKSPSEEQHHENT